MPFPAGNDTAGPFAPTGTGAFTDTALPTFGNQASTTTSSCTTSSLVTETSTNFITVTATPEANTKAVSVSQSVSAGAFYGGGNGRSNTWSGNSWGSSTSAVAGASSSAGSFKPSTTFATMTTSAAGSGFGTSSAAGSKTTSAAATTSASSGSSGSSSGKRGISYNDASLVSAFGNAVSWCYNWGETAGGSPGVEYVPMMWGTNNVDGFSANGASHVLSFNEPDLSSQSNIDPQTAATLHKKVMTSIRAGGVKVGSPAVTNGAGTSPAMGVDWLDQFFAACGTDCPVDFVAYHWYAGADQINYFQQHTEDVIAIANKYGVSKVWLTEFQPTSGSDSDQANFMQQAVEYLDGNGSVERYAAFMASSGTLLSGTSLNTIGSAYADA